MAERQRLLSAAVRPTALRATVSRPSAWIADRAPNVDPIDEHQ